MNKQSIIYLHNRIQLSNIKDFTDRYSKNESQNVLWIEVKEKGTYCMIIRLYKILENPKYCLNSVTRSRLVVSWGDGGKVKNTMRHIDTKKLLG